MNTSKELRSAMNEVIVSHATLTEYEVTSHKGRKSPVRVTVNGSEGEVLAAFTAPVGALSTFTKAAVDAYQQMEPVIRLLENVEAEAEAVAEGREFSRLDEQHGDIIA
jgi:hypothetical protein